MGAEALDSTSRSDGSRSTASILDESCHYIAAGCALCRFVFGGCASSRGLASRGHCTITRVHARNTGATAWLDFLRASDGGCFLLHGIFGSCHRAPPKPALPGGYGGGRISRRLGRSLGLHCRGDRDCDHNLCRCRDRLFSKVSGRLSGRGCYSREHFAIL